MPQHCASVLPRVVVAIFLCAGWSLASPSPLASAEPLCQVQLGGKIATVPCGTCEDVLAEPGMAGNVACSEVRPAVTPPPAQQSHVGQGDVPGMRHDPCVVSRAAIAASTCLAEIGTADFFRVTMTVGPAMSGTVRLTGR